MVDISQYTTLSLSLSLASTWLELIYLRGAILNNVCVKKKKAFSTWQSINSPFLDIIISLFLKSDTTIDLFSLGKLKITSLSQVLIR